MSATRSIYKVFRSIFFAAVLAVILLFAALYIAVSIPSVQNEIRLRAQKELSKFFGSKVEIGEVEIFPFNELRLHEVAIYTPAGRRCVSVGRLGAGISLWSLLSSGKIEVTYAELISLDGRLEQNDKDGKLNIDFIIKAFEPKDKNKPPADFDVVLRNVVIRKSRVSFDRTYIPKVDNPCLLDFNHILLTDLRADIAMPVITNDMVSVDLRRLAFDEQSGLKVNSLSLKSVVTPNYLTLSDFRLRLDDTDLSLSDQKVDYNGYTDILNALQTGDFSVVLKAKPLNLSEFSCLLPQLSVMTHPSELYVDLNGSVDRFRVNSFRFEDFRNNAQVTLSGVLDGILHPANVVVDDMKLSMQLPFEFTTQILDMFPMLDPSVKSRLAHVGDIKAELSGSVDMETHIGELNAGFETGAGELSVNAIARGIGQNEMETRLSLTADKVDLASLLDREDFGDAGLEADADLKIVGKQFAGSMNVSIPYISWKGHQFENINIEAEKTGETVTALVESADQAADLTTNLRVTLAGKASEYHLDAEVRRLLPALFGLKGFGADESVSTSVAADIAGNHPDNLTGEVYIADFHLEGGKRPFTVSRLDVKSETEGDNRLYTVDSDFLTGSLRGDMTLSRISAIVADMLAHTLPSFFSAPKLKPDNDGCRAEFDFTVKPSEKLFSFLKTPVRPGVPVTIKGSLDCMTDSVSLTVNAPYLIQGRNKLIRNTAIEVVKSPGTPCRLMAETDFPLKNDRARLRADVEALNDSVDLSLNWQGVNVPANRGAVALNGHIFKTDLMARPSVNINVLPSGFDLNGAEWRVTPASLHYADKSIQVNDLVITNGSQFIDISGRGSEFPADLLTVKLSQIDLEYIFDILNIDHVDFGGKATGIVKVSSLFSKAPLAYTDGLFVKNLAYNGCVLGDGNLESHWDNAQKMVAINADITAQDAEASVRGGVYVTRDSLSFDFGARHLDIEFLQPFMSGFTSRVQGHASGNIKLYGTFSDIDLGGAVHADDVSMLVDYTNVTYSGSDSIFFSPGRISIPGIQLYDKYGNSCHMTGEVTHKFLKDPSFNFQMTDARKLLAYDTDARMNPSWYGRIFTNGSASLKGRPGMISLAIDMSTAPGSEFNLVLDETEEATEYTFLTFSDKRRESADTIEVKQSFEDLFYSGKSSVQEETVAEDFFLNLSLDVTPEAKMIIVMDPAAGDKINANGRGALQFSYNTRADQFTIYGKYTLINGWYNFSLQDLILKNFKIEEGSSISFNGDPMRGLLDITAAYRVNTNLKDLDASFENDPDLNRTVVPVDALLHVSGDIHAPEIKFDIAMPTVTSEVERKVRSIISTEDMLNRQVIYLLALNRFYTPEYMGAEQGGEIASVASSTLSSQVQNIIGSLTDRFMVAPSFKSEKSDFSDMEVDLALSSSFFDNRLLLNGNLGYRDKSTSQTTFIGDFDLEYLLSRDGKLRLKAYNHFNDASYYLKSALTTQGIGIVYRKDFDDPLKFIKRLFRRKREEEKE